MKSIVLVLLLLLPFIGYAEEEFDASIPCSCTTVDEYMLAAWSIRWQAYPVGGFITAVNPSTGTQFMFRFVQMQGTEYKAYIMRTAPTFQYYSPRVLDRVSMDQAVELLQPPPWTPENVAPSSGSGTVPEGGNTITVPGYEGGADPYPGFNEPGFMW